MMCDKCGAHYCGQVAWDLVCDAAFYRELGRRRARVRIAGGKLGGWPKGLKRGGLRTTAEQARAASSAGVAENKSEISIDKLI